MRGWNLVRARITTHHTALALTRFICRYKTIKARCPTTETLDFPDVPHGFFNRGNTSDDVVAAAVSKCGQAITSFIGKHFE